MCANNPSCTKVVGVVDVLLSVSLLLVAVILTTLPLWGGQPPITPRQSLPTLEKAADDDEGITWWWIRAYNPKPENPSIQESLWDSSRLSEPTTWVVFIGAPALFTFMLVLAAILLIQATNPKRPPSESLEMLRLWNYCSIFFGVALCGVYTWTAVAVLGPRFHDGRSAIILLTLLLLRGSFILVVRRFQSHLEGYSSIPSSRNSTLAYSNYLERSTAEDAQGIGARLGEIRRLPFDEQKRKMNELQNSHPGIHGVSNGRLNCYGYAVMRYNIAAMRASDEVLKRDFGGGGRSRSRGSCDDGALFQCVAPCAGNPGRERAGRGKRGRRRMSDV